MQLHDLLKHLGWTWRFKATGYKRMIKHSQINWARFNTLAMALVGKPYVYGSETNLKDPDPSHIQSLDCSELVEWLYAQVYIVVPDGSYNQFRVCRPITGEPQIGDLGFKWHPDTQEVHHVGIYLKDYVIEAKGKKWGVVLTPRADFEKSPDWAMWKRLNQIEDA